MWFIGTSGWQYRDWKESFYPSDLPQRSWLEYYADNFNTVELNNAFYRLPAKDMFAQWHKRTPDDFVISVKASRYITHIKRLTDVAEPVARLLDRTAGLGDALGPILLQLPPNLSADADRLAQCLANFPANIRIAVEPRHESWFNNDIHDVLQKFGAALCWADRGSRPITPLWRTTDWGYLRLHEGSARSGPSYGTRAMKTRIERLQQTWPSSADRYVYFNNDVGGAAVHNAQTMKQLTDDL